MYNDEKNLYHYTYRKDGSESTHAPEGQPSVDDQLSAFQSQNGPQQPIQEMKPVKKNRMGLKVTALALCCALLGGAVGGGEVLEPPAQGLVVLPAVDPRLTLAQQVQVGSVEDEEFHNCNASSTACAVSWAVARLGMICSAHCR